MLSVFCLPLLLLLFLPASQRDTFLRDLRLRKNESLQSCTCFFFALGTSCWKTIESLNTLMFFISSFLFWASLLLSWSTRFSVFIGRQGLPAAAIYHLKSLTRPHPLRSPPFPLPMATPPFAGTPAGVLQHPRRPGVHIDTVPWKAHRGWWSLRLGVSTCRTCFVFSPCTCF